MATKFLARTVIEGGRSRYNKHARRYSNRSARRRVHCYLRKLYGDAVLRENDAIPTRRKVYRWHADKLRPAERWLASFVGKPWNDVHSAMMSRFDTRTIAGQHIVFDHLLASVRIGESYSWRRYAFFVDEDGRLQHVTRRPRRRGKMRLTSTPDDRE